MARRTPGDNVSPDQFQTVTTVLASDWCQKTFVFCVLCPHYLPLGLRGCFFLRKTKNPRILVCRLQSSPYFSVVQESASGQAKNLERGGKYRQAGVGDDKTTDCLSALLRYSSFFFHALWAY